MSTLPRNSWVPWPDELRTFDREKRHINSGVLVLGSSAADVLRYVHRNTRGEGKTVDVSTPGQPFYNYVPLQLGDLRGYQTHFHLYAFGDDERLRPMVYELLPFVRGLIVATAGSLGDNVRAVLAEEARFQPNLPVALLASDATRLEWTRTTRTPLVFEGPSSDEQIFPALKLVAKGILTNLRDG